MRVGYRPETIRGYVIAAVEHGGEWILMSSFTQPLTVTKITARMWRIERAFAYHVGSEESGDIIDVPWGFCTDFASVPRAFWIIFPPDGEYTQAPVLHDFLYFTQTRTRLASDNIFLEAMKVLKVAWYTRYPIYWAVRSFAWLAWKSKRGSKDFSSVLV